MKLYYIKIKPCAGNEMEIETQEERGPVSNSYFKRFFVYIFLNGGYRIICGVSIPLDFGRVLESFYF